MYKPVCRTAIANCRYYRKDREACFECQNGFTVKHDGTCMGCTNGKTGKNIYGERVCVDALVTNCLLYSVKGD